jgi:nicotinic acid mononucleotide adenylyltransferase
MKAILILPAALCPIHKDHINILKAAKEDLERKKYTVTKAYILPSSEKYVNSKTEGHFLDSLEIRVKLCQIATKDIDWIEVLDWGMASGNKARKLIQEKNPDAKVFIVAGSDTTRNKKDPSLIIVQRDWKAASSTKVRKAIKEKDWVTVNELVGEDVAEYLYFE